MWTLVTRMKMRFCERHIRVNRQEVAVAERMKLREFAEESEIATVASN